MQKTAKYLLFPLFVGLLIVAVSENSNTIASQPDNTKLTAALPTSNTTSGNTQTQTNPIFNPAVTQTPAPDNNFDDGLSDLAEYLEQNPPQNNTDADSDPVEDAGDQETGGDDSENNAVCPEGVECDEGQGKLTPFQCPSSNSVLQAGCNVNKELAARQVSIGIGAPKPAMEITYGPDSCNVWTPLGSGACYQKASRQCPTVQKYGGSGAGESCFWENCKTQCGVEPEPPEPCVMPLAQLSLLEIDRSTMYGKIKYGLLSAVILAGDKKPCPISIGAAGQESAAAQIDGLEQGLQQTTTGNTSQQSGTNTDLQQALKPNTTGNTSQQANTNTNTNANPNTSANLQQGTGNTNQQNTSPGSTPANANAQRIAAANAQSTPYTGNVDSQSGFSRTPGQPGNDIGNNSQYSSFDTPRSLQNRPKSLAQRDTGSFSNFLDNFVKNPFTYQTPEGEKGGEPRVVYVVPENLKKFISGQRTQEYKTIQEIASDVASQTGDANIARVDHFAQTLNAVGGPSEASTENKSYGRIQDLIVEDEAIRALRVAEEAGKRAKNSVYCRPSEASEDCQARREAKQKEVERATFVKELDERVLPEASIQHFLAVYDGWVRPSPAPHVRATSTLAVLEQAQADPFAAYEYETDGTNFVLWALENMVDATKNVVSNAVDAVTNFFGGDSEDEDTPDPTPAPDPTPSAPTSPQTVDPTPSSDVLNGQTIDEILDTLPAPAPPTPDSVPSAPGPTGPPGGSAPGPGGADPNAPSGPPGVLSV